ncbi:AfsA-related hotdog domain-containing protein [Streptomyces stramineus]
MPRPSASSRPSPPPAARRRGPPHGRRGSPLPTSDPRQWLLRHPFANTVLYDHPVDHVPGLVLIEAAHQAVRHLTQGHHSDGPVPRRQISAQPPPCPRFPPHHYAHHFPHVRGIRPALHPYPPLHS